MKFWFGRKNKQAATPSSDGNGNGNGNGNGTDSGKGDGSDAQAPSSDDAQAQAAKAPPTGTARAPASAATRPPASARPPTSMLSAMNGRLLEQAAAAKPQTGALNDQIVQAVQLSNAETTAYAPSQIAIGPNMMIGQASGLIAQSSAAYFDGVSKLALASQSILLKEMTENLVKENLAAAAEDAIGVLATDVLLGAAAAVAAAAGALEAESASFAIDKIDQSIAKYSDVMRSRKAAAN